MNNISEHLLLNRVNRKLVTEPEGTRIRRCRYDSRWFSELGRYYAVDDDNIVVSKYVNLDDWAREIGVLAPIN